MTRRNVLNISNRDKNWQARQAKDREFWEARFDRLNCVPRIIRNPLGAAAVKEVIDQIPRVKADLDRSGK